MALKKIIYITEKNGVSAADRFNTLASTGTLDGHTYDPNNIDYRAQVEFVDGFIPECPQTTDGTFKLNADVDSPAAPVYSWKEDVPPTLADFNLKLSDAPGGKSPTIYYTKTEVDQLIHSVACYRHTISFKIRVGVSDYNIYRFSLISSEIKAITREDGTGQYMQNLDAVLNAAYGLSVHINGTDYVGTVILENQPDQLFIYKVNGTTLTTINPGQAITDFVDTVEEL